MPCSCKIIYSYNMLYDGNMYAAYYRCCAKFGTSFWWTVMTLAIQFATLYMCKSELVCGCRCVIYMHDKNKVPRDLCSFTFESSQFAGAMHRFSSSTSIISWIIYSIIITIVRVSTCIFDWKLNEKTVIFDDLTMMRLGKNMVANAPSSWNWRWVSSHWQIAQENLAFSSCDKGVTSQLWVHNNFLLCLFSLKKGQFKLKTFTGFT